jgi:hypothetical protein
VSDNSSLLQLLEGLQDSLTPLKELANSSGSSSSSTWSALQELRQSVQLLHTVMHEIGQMGQTEQQLPGSQQLGRLRVALRAVYQVQLPALARHPAAVQYWLQHVKGMPQVCC